MDESNFASLGPSLLARKGGAKPAMRPQLGPLTSGSNAAHNLEDLGWNDMGEEPESHHDGKVLNLTPEPANAEMAAEAEALAAKAGAALHTPLMGKPEVRRQQEAIAEQIRARDEEPHARMHAVQAAYSEAEASAPKRPRRSALERGKRAAFTLRLDADRHLKLRLASTLRNRSAQQLLTEALDQFLGKMPDVKNLAAEARKTD